MSVALRTITRLQDADDINVSLGAGVDEYALCWDNDTARFVLRAMSGGGVTDHGALTGLADDDHGQYLLATGARTGASSQAQAFTNGIIGPSWKPSADSTTALQLQNAAGTAIVTVDTSNSRVGVGKTPAVPFDLVGSSANNVASYLNKNDAINWGGVYFGFAEASGANEFGITAGAYNAGGNRLLRWIASGSPTGWSFNATADDLLSFEYRFMAKAGLMGGYHTDLDIVLNQHTNGGADKGIKFKVNGGSATVMAVMETSKVGIQTTSPDSPLHVHLDDAATNAVSQLLTLSHNTSGTAAAGFGSGVLWELKSSTTADQSAARVQALWYEATHASRKADLVLTAFDTAEREGLRIRGAGSGPAIGFYGVSPIERATLATGAGASVDDVITALQNLGLVKQS